MDLAEADRHAREQIEHHRAEMGRWRLIRAQRLLAEREAGKRAEDIAAEIDVSVPTVYEVMRAAKKAG
ncbi:hypothetical protein [Roseateles sp.]|uniref:hypothetical protein n=1 Tax=Roseateles sp. TaxID=1971397 RepID=UPI002F408947